MEIANIITSDVDKLNVGPEFNVVSDINDIIYKELPLLVIGYDLACQVYGVEELNPLKRFYTTNKFWTFTKLNKRAMYEDDLDNFIKHAYKTKIDNLHFINVDFIQMSKKNLYKVIKKILSLENIITYMSDNEIIYLYDVNLVFIIDLNLLSYVNFDKLKALEKIKQKSKVFLTSDEVFIEYSEHLNRFDNDVKLIPFLYSINPYE